MGPGGTKAGDGGPVGCECEPVVPNVPPVKRKRTFEVRMVPASTLAATLELIADVNPAIPAAISNTLEFEKFVALNDRPAGTVSQDFLLLLFAIDLLRFAYF